MLKLGDKHTMRSNFSKAEVVGEPLVNLLDMPVNGKLVLTFRMFSVHIMKWSDLESLKDSLRI